MEQSGGALPVPYVACNAFSTTAPNCFVATSARTSFASPRVWSVTVRRILFLFVSETSLWLGSPMAVRAPGAGSTAAQAFEGAEEAERRCRAGRLKLPEKVPRRGRHKAQQHHEQATPALLGRARHFQIQQLHDGGRRGLLDEGQGAGQVAENVVSLGDRHGPVAKAQQPTCADRRAMRRSVRQILSTTVGGGADNFMSVSYQDERKFARVGLTHLKEVCGTSASGGRSLPIS